MLGEEDWRRTTTEKVVAKPEIRAHLILGTQEAIKKRDGLQLPSPRGLEGGTRYCHVQTLEWFSSTLLSKATYISTFVRRTRNNTSLAVK